MASSAPSTNATTSIAATVAQIAEHAVVEEVKAVASQVQKSNAADLKNIVSNVSKEAVAAKAEDHTTLVEKVEEGSKEVAKDVVIGAESAGKEIEAHPELIAEGAVVAVAGVVSLVAPEVAIGGVAMIGKMAADSAKKTIDGIATDSSSKVVKQISNDLTKDVVNTKKSSDTPPVPQTEVAIDAKAVVKVDGGEAATGEVNLHATAVTDAAKNVDKAVFIPSTKVDAAAQEVSSSEAKAVTGEAAQDTSNSAHGKSVNQTSDAPKAVDTSSRPVVAAAAVVAPNPSSTASIAPSTAASVGASAIAPTPPIEHPQVTTTTTSTPTSAPAQELLSGSSQATALAESVADDSLAHLYQKLDSINENLQRKDLTELYQKMDAMHITLQNIATLLTGIAQAQFQAQEHAKPQLDSAADVSVPAITPPLSLITPPLPPTTVETRSDLALGNAQGSSSISNGDASSARPKVADIQTSKRPGMFEGLGKLFYLRS